jgi:hypothetical protein
MASNAETWLNTLIAHAKTGKEERDAEAKELESALAKEPVDVPVDLTGATPGTRWPWHGICAHVTVRGSLTAGADGHEAQGEKDDSPPATDTDPTGERQLSKCNVDHELSAECAPYCGICTACSALKFVLASVCALSPLHVQPRSRHWLRQSAKLQMRRPRNPLSPKVHPLFRTRSVLQLNALCTA